MATYRFLKAYNIFGINDIVDEDSPSSKLVAEWSESKKNASNIDSNTTSTSLTSSGTAKSYGSVGSHH